MPDAAGRKEPRAVRMRAWMAMTPEGVLYGEPRHYLTDARRSIASPEYWPDARKRGWRIIAVTVTITPERREGE